MNNLPIWLEIPIKIMMVIYIAIIIKLIYQLFKTLKEN